MRLIFVGPQGSGKGTQAKIIARRLGIPHISIGDLLRSLSGKLKEEADSFMLQGKLVPDKFIIKILKARLSKKDTKKGFIIDGFPRNIAQADELDEITKIDKVVEIWISDEEAIKRILSRVSCMKCGMVYNEITHPPKKAGFCDECGSPLIKRFDDNEETIKQRLDIYHKETEPILEHYKSIRINGEQPIKNVTEDILKALC